LHITLYYIGIITVFPWIDLRSISASSIYGKTSKIDLSRSELVSLFSLNSVLAEIKLRLIDGKTVIVYF